MSNYFWVCILLKIKKTIFARRQRSGQSERALKGGDGTRRGVLRKTHRLAFAKFPLGIARKRLDNFVKRESADAVREWKRVQCWVMLRREAVSGWLQRNARLEILMELPFWKWERIINKRPDGSWLKQIIKSHHHFWWFINTRARKKQRRCIQMCLLNVRQTWKLIPFNYDAKLNLLQRECT